MLSVCRADRIVTKIYFSVDDLSQVHLSDNEDLHTSPGEFKKTSSVERRRSRQEKVQARV